MDKLWYIKIKGKKQGPYTIQQLKKIKEVTPDTLVWYDVVNDWVAMRYVFELKDVFKDPPHQKGKEKKDEKAQKKKLSEELALELPNSSPPFIFWTFAALALLALLSWQFFRNR